MKKGDRFFEVFKNDLFTNAECARNWLKIEYLFFLGCKEETIAERLPSVTDIHDRFFIEKNAKTIFNWLVQELKIILESCHIKTKKDNSFFLTAQKNKYDIFSQFLAH